MTIELDLRDKVTLFVGRRNSGKSYCLKHLIEEQKHFFKEVFIFSPSSFSGYWKGVVEDTNVQEEYKEEWVTQLIKKMTHLNKGKDQKSDDFVRVLLVLDDVVTSDIKAHQSKTLRILAARGRHTGLAVCVTSQYLKSVSPTLRNNADLMLYGKSNAHSDEILYEEYSMAGDMNHDQFMRFVRANTNDHTFLVINNAASNTSNRLNVYGSFKAPTTINTKVSLEGKKTFLKPTNK